MIVFFDFIYGTLLYNFEYASNLFNWIYSGNIIKKIIVYLVCFFPSYAILILGILKFRKEKNIKSIFYILLGVLENILFLIGNLYPHYAIIALPNLVIIFCEFENYIKKNKNIVYKIIAILFCFWNIIYAINTRNLISTDNEKIDELVSKIDDKNSFIAVNLNDYKEIYINNNIIPFYKYFVLQDWQAVHSDKMKNDLINEFKEGNVKYILIQNEQESVIYDILLNKYKCQERINLGNSIISLYVLK